MPIVYMSSALRLEAFTLWHLLERMHAYNYGQLCMTRSDYCHWHGCNLLWHLGLQGRCRLVLMQQQSGLVH